MPTAKMLLLVDRYMLSFFFTFPLLFTIA